MKLYIIGNTAIYLALTFSIYSLFAFIIGIIKQNQRFIKNGKAGLFAGFTFTLTSIITLAYILGTSQMQFKYVANYTNIDLSLAYKLTALWAGNSGSLLLWVFLLTLFATMVTFSRKSKNNHMIPYVALIILVNIIFFFIVLSWSNNPFELLENVPMDGKGLNPILQNPGMVLHPVTLYIGYVGLVVPFAFAIAALILKKTDSSWISLTRRWAIISWLFLTFGNIIGGYWSYQVLGWGGYWAWDPVENASFMPWLTLTAFIHSAMIQERKNKFKIWNISLIIISYLLTLFGTFLVRGGLLNSVHSFAKSDLSTYFLAFMVIMIVLSIYFFMSRYNLLRSKNAKLEPFFSKENSFLINNVILVGATLAIFGGTVFPQVSHFLTGTKVSLGTPYFNTVLAPILLGLLVVMAVCPLLTWKNSSIVNLRTSLLIPGVLSISLTIVLYFIGIRTFYPIISFSIVFFLISTHLLDFYYGAKTRRKMTDDRYLIGLWKFIVKNHRHYGGFIVHLGIALIAIGIIGSNNYGLETIKSVGLGETITIKDYTIRYEDITVKEFGEKYTFIAKMRVEKDGKFLTYVQPGKIYFRNVKQMTTQIALKSTLKEDLYIVLNAWETDKSATFIVKVNPLVKWIWIGGVFIFFGTLIVVWKRKYDHGSKED